MNSKKTGHNVVHRTTEGNGGKVGMTGEGCGSTREIGGDSRMSDNSRDASY